ncbi:MAG TPA: phage minor head protein [Gemmatimonadaceae bacterium]|nr:phage minor head protein [Gemmatimonadaceae bacterium]
MTKAERAFWTRVTRKAASFTPELRGKIIQAFRLIADSLSQTQMQKAIESGYVDRIFDEALTEARLDRAFQPVRDELRASIESGAKYAGRDLPKAGNIDFAFNSLSPRVIEAVRQLDTRVIRTLQESVRETVRAHVENGLRDGVNPREIARGIREVIGLAPNQERAVENFRKALEKGGRSALTRALRDKRFDKTVIKGDLTTEQVDKMTAAYRRKMVAFNAETNARTAALDSMKLGQRLSYQQAVEQGILDGNRLEKTWVGVMDARERPSHVAMEGDTVPFNQPFSNGQMIPGETEFNCRCLARYRQTRAA